MCLYEYDEENHKIRRGGRQKKKRQNTLREKARADEEKARADEEKLRADEAFRKIAMLEKQLAELKE